MQLDFKEGKEHISKAILVGIVTRENSADEVEKELDELPRAVRNLPALCRTRRHPIRER